MPHEVIKNEKSGAIASLDRPEDAYDPDADRETIKKARRQLIIATEQARPDLIISAIKLWGLQASVEVAQSMFEQAKNPKSSSRVKEAFLKLFWLPMLDQPDREQEMALKALQLAQSGTLNDVLGKLADQIEESGKRRAARAEPVSEAEFEEVLTGLRATLIAHPEKIMGGSVSEVERVEVQEAKPAPEPLETDPDDQDNVDF